MPAIITKFFYSSLGLLYTTVFIYLSILQALLVRERNNYISHQIFVKSGIVYNAFISFNRLKRKGN